jgi:hypothetical protein
VQTAFPSSTNTTTGNTGVVSPAPSATQETYEQSLENQ